jgi:uncharacterized protein YbjT (DUF2867 family)
MILLTGATGNVGGPLLRRLVPAGERVRCLVRDPRRLGAERVRVQIALGDLAEPASFRNALRGVDTVVHLAAAIRDQPRASIEELSAVATLRLVRAAERAGARRFVYFSVLGASRHAQARLLRAKSLAEEAVVASELESVVFAPSLVYSPGDAWLALLDRLSLLPVVPVPGDGRALFQPMWAGDAADCVVAALAGRAEASARYELAGPETLSHAAIVRTALRARRRRRALVPVPAAIARAGLRLVEAGTGSAAPATWDEAELLQVSLTTTRGTADAEALGISPRPMAQVLGLRSRA